MWVLFGTTTHGYSSDHKNQRTQNRHNRCKSFLKTNDFSLLHIDYNLGFLLMLLTFVGGWLGYLFLLKMQRIPLLSTLTSRKNLTFQGFCRYGHMAFPYGNCRIVLLFYQSRCIPVSIPSFSIYPAFNHWYPTYTYPICYGGGIFQRVYFTGQF